MLGYPGDLTPGRPLHLIVLPGVEFDRAMRLCEEFEPNFVSLGIGIGDGEFDEEVRRKVEQVSEKIVKQYNASCTKFTFSTLSAIQTTANVTEAAAQMSGFNTVIAAMSNKISTVGVAIAGITNTQFQLTYAEPIEYNIDNYSAPSDAVIYFKLNKAADGRIEYMS